MIKVYIVVLEDSNEFSGVFGTRGEAELFVKTLRTPSVILERYISSFDTYKR